MNTTKNRSYVFDEMPDDSHSPVTSEIVSIYCFPFKLNGKLPINNEVGVSCIRTGWR